MFYICNKCGHQFVRDIQPCPDCGDSKGMKLIEKKVVEKPEIQQEKVEKRVEPKKKGKK